MIRRLLLTGLLIFSLGATQSTPSESPRKPKKSAEVASLVASTTIQKVNSTPFQISSGYKGVLVGFDITTCGVTCNVLLLVEFWSAADGSWQTLITSTGTAVGDTVYQIYPTAQTAVTAIDVQLDGPMPRFWRVALDQTNTVNLTVFVTVTTLE